MASPTISDYLAQASVMQLATVSNDKPWICTVYFVADDANNLYWLSFPERRHSKDLAKNAYAAVTMAIKVDKPVVGLSAEGRVRIVEDIDAIESIMRLYVAKYGAGHKFHENVINKTNQHVMYTLTPEIFTIFDELHYSPEEARREITN